MNGAGRRLESLTLDNVDDLPQPCRSCIFWELDPVAADRAQEAGDVELEKEAWLSATLLEWGSCGMVAYIQDTPVGYVLYAPPAYVPRSTIFPTSPIGADAVQLVTARVLPELRRTGLGRTLIQGAAHDLLRRGYRAVEAFGVAADIPRNGVEANCLVPASFLLSVGFKTIRPHRKYPRCRLDLRSTVAVAAEVESAIDRLIDVVRPEPVLTPGVSAATRAPLPQVRHADLPRA